ncbi:hypothetical protein OIU34_26680 [Pararhizobium sp. BT-229]|uniref:hypothetical protein n=1 Tax=Pararhizobium sp. BT-229 TaxID=2986923 RepID=UPI0021F7FD0F|nr:hypothetical protein [Pararhizobium sp. BT-229]MCV9965469.1 hypothetical protein [Pararhizobium sp. BT-229]
MTLDNNSGLIGFEKPGAKTGRVKRWLSNPGVAAAFGSFLAFSAAQVAEYAKASIQDNHITAREELAEARALMNTIPVASNYAEAISIVKKLERQVNIYTTEEAKSYIQTFIPGAKANEEERRLEAEQAALLKKQADDAAALAAQTAANDAAKAQAEAAAAAAAAAEAAAARQRQAELQARIVEERDLRFNRWLKF